MLPPSPFAEAVGVIVGRSPARRLRRGFRWPSARAAACCGWIGRWRKRSGCAEVGRLPIACKAALFRERSWRQRWSSNSSRPQRRPVRVDIRRISIWFGHHMDIQLIFFGWRLSIGHHLHMPRYPYAIIDIGYHIPRLPYPYATISLGDPKGAKRISMVYVLHYQ